MTVDGFDYSPLAKRVTKGVQNPLDGLQRTAWGYLIHTTGGGVLDKAKAQGKKPLDVALAYYFASQAGANGYRWGGPHYVCDHDGTLYQVAPDDVKTAHCGGRSEKYPNGTRSLYIDGNWITKIPAAVVALWRKRWPNAKHPYALFPSRDPNTDYVGLEMIPVGNGFGGEPMRKGLRFTKAQHDAAIMLGRDLGMRHEWPDGWQNTGRLVGHEDVDILNRSDSLGGWDPGACRPDPYFDFDMVRTAIGMT